MRIGVGERFEAHETKELVHLVPMLGEHAARDQSGFDVAANGEPREKVGILKHQSALGARSGDRLIAEPKFPRGRLVEPGDQAQQRGLAAAAGADQGDHGAGVERK